MTSLRHDGQVVFRFYRPDAMSVKVVGCFNGWNGASEETGRSIEMKQVAQGWWQASADIEPGEYRFRYVADGNWFTDFAANGVEKNKYGWNSVLIIPERRMKIGGSNDLVMRQGADANEALAA